MMSLTTDIKDKDTEMKGCFQPTPYKISTITGTGSMNANISLDVLYENVSVNDNLGIVYVEYGNKKSDTIQKGSSKKKKNIVDGIAGKTRKRFDNQVTIVYKYLLKDTDTIITVNCKIFKNGNVQMTGLRYIDHGKEIVNYLITLIKNIYEKDKRIVKDIQKLENTNHRIRLINCDFRTGIEIKRDKLYKTILNEYKTICTYEPCIYPGVKVQYWWNKHNTHNDGACYCKQKCDGKGIGIGDGQCKKITIAVFQSGCIIITGGQTLEQIDDSYKFICDCIRNNLDEIEKPKMLLPIIEPKKRKVYIKKSDIVS
jgi:TATA-box binding protein (TBP) (component of TFIID and TFIIIB)